MSHPRVRYGALALVAGAVGCNAILDNEPGHRSDMRTSSDVAPTQPTADASTSGDPPQTQTPPPGDPDSGVRPGPVCEGDWMTCDGLCVPRTDPLYGCGDPSCKPCSVAHGAAGCEAGKCTARLCDPGYADCNKAPSDGCETDLSKAASCGSCATACPAQNPVCAPSAGTFACTTGCTPIAPSLCGSECVEPLTNANHCGGCNQKCPEIEHAISECRLGTCGFTCQAPYHACNGKCWVPTDPAACGPACTVCPAVPNAVPTCQADTCGFACSQGFADCNAQPGDGCEVNLASDPYNCNGCGISCNGGECLAGVCTPRP